MLGSGMRLAGPFALVYPAVLIATLYGHWRAGLLASILTLAWSWYVDLPVLNSFRLENSADSTRLLLNVISTMFVLVLAESFRRLVAIAIAERDAEIARSELLLQELEHRTKNNFALVVSLLRLQAREASNEQTRQALDMATARVHSFARAHDSLGRRAGVGCVAMKPYLTEMIAQFSRGAFPDGVAVAVDVADTHFPREKAVAVALFANEALTNSSKYAFPNGRSGHVDVCLAGDEHDWELVVADDGVGASARDRSGGGTPGGLGTRLMTAFAERAKARFEVDLTARGCRVRLIGTSEPALRAWRSALRTAVAGTNAPSTSAPQPQAH
jgi:two-component sensor histidine kinase